MDRKHGNLAGKRALVTGAGNGLGREIALEFARQGAEVGLHYASSRTGADDAAGQIAAMGGTAHVLQADLRLADEAIRLADQAAEMLGGLDIAVNNAGLTDTKPFLDFTPAEYDALFNLNMRGMFFCAQAAARHMVENGGGVILNMSSIHGFASLPGYSVYAPTKGAIIAFTKQLAVELAPYRIRVNGVAPGCIIVPSDYEKTPDLDVGAIGRSIPAGRVGQPVEVARLMAFLASDHAGYMTGHIAAIDGGILARAALDTPEAVG